MHELKALFERCLAADYRRTPESGDYCMQIEGDTLYLLFQWSNGAEDWKNNFDFPARPYKRMSEAWLCHRGFARVWKAMRDEIEENVERALRTSGGDVERIVCVGYSHGAALAVFAAEDMAYHYGRRYTVKGYGFGAPRVLWGIIPRAVKQRLECFTTVRCVPDLVTHVPPALLGYRHAGRLQKIGKLGKYSPIKAHYQDSYIAELIEYKKA